MRRHPENGPGFPLRMNGTEAMLEAGARQVRAPPLACVLLSGKKERKKKKRAFVLLIARHVRERFDGFERGVGARSSTKPLTRRYSDPISSSLFIPRLGMPCKEVKTGEKEGKGREKKRGGGNSRKEFQRQNAVHPKPGPAGRNVQ